MSQINAQVTGTEPCLTTGINININSHGMCVPYLDPIVPYLNPIVPYLDPIVPCLDPIVPCLYPVVPYLALLVRADAR